MGFWDNLGEKVDDIGEKVTKTGKDAIDKTKDIAESVKLKSELRSIEKQITVAYAKIGKEYVNKNKGCDDLILPEVVSEIAELKKTAVSLKERIAELGGLIACPVCKASCDKNDAFCRSCGAQLNDEE